MLSSRLASSAHTKCLNNVHCGPVFGSWNAVIRGSGSGRLADGNCRGWMDAIITTPGQSHVGHEAANTRIPFPLPAIIAVDDFMKGPETWPALY